jgi:protein required for attachment to host cells
MGLVEHKYDELFLVADPKFLGITRDVMPNDISWNDESEIAEFYRNLRWPDA